MTDHYTEDLQDWETRRPPDQSDEERAAIDALYAEAERRGLFVQHIVPFIAYAEDGTEIAGLHVRDNLRLVDDDGNEVASGPDTPEQRRADAIREQGSEVYFSGRAEKLRASPHQQPKAWRERTQKRLKRRRHGTQCRIDRKPPNQSDEERATIKAFYAACPPGHSVDHIVPWWHKRLRGLETLVNLQYLTKRENDIKGQRIMTSAQIQQELETGIRMAEPTEADLQGYVDAGMALWAEDVPENPETGIALPNWPARYRS